MSDKIQERISKLLKLAQNNPSEEEAARALEKASQLAMQHGLELAIQEDNQTLSVDPIEVRVYEGTSYPYVLCVSSAISALYPAKIIIHHLDARKKIWLGACTDRNLGDAVIDSFSFLLNQVEALYKINLPRGMTVSERANYRRTFKYACASRVYARCKELNRSAQIAQGSHNELTIYDYNKIVLGAVRRFQRDQYPDLHYSRARTRKLGRGSFDGYRAGNRVNLRKSIS